MEHVAVENRLRCPLSESFTVLHVSPLSVVGVGADEEAGGIRMLRKYANQDLSLTDAVGLHIMRVGRLTVCWSTDRHLGLAGAILAVDER